MSVMIEVNVEIFRFCQKSVQGRPKKNNFSTQKLTKMFDIYLKYIPSLCDPS